MKSKPVKLMGMGYADASVEEATHLIINIPGPTGHLTLPVIRHGTRSGTGCWSWNGSVDAPTLRPSILTEGHRYLGGDPLDQNQWLKFRCHVWVNDGKVKYLDDCSHDLRGQTCDLGEVRHESS